MSKLPEAQRFLRSVNLEHDYNEPSALAGYVVSPVAQQTLLRVLRDLSRNQGTRAWNIVGPYGTGKSSFLVFLTWMLAGGDKAKRAEARLRQDWPYETDRCVSLLDPISEGMEPVLVTGHRGPLEPALLAGLLQTAERLWPTAPLTDEIRDAVKRSRKGPLGDHTTYELYLLAAQQVRKTKPAQAGLLVVVDEFGKFLEYAASRGGIGDVYILQQLAEIAPRIENTRIGLITVLHQDFDAYAVDLPTIARNEWTKIKGRFEPITFMESAEHLLMLVAGGVAASGARRQGQLFALQPDNMPDISSIKGLGNQQRQLLASCLPLHPLTAMALGPLFRHGFGQNERSIFAFLLSKEPYGFQEFLDRKERAHYGLDDLYDYLKMTANTQGRGATARLWAMAETAFSRLPKNSDAIDIRLIKVICLISFLDNIQGIRADKAVLALALEETESKVEASLRRLQHASVIVYRRFKSAYELWAGSDLDIDDVIASTLRSVKAEGGYASLLQNQLRPGPVVAARHYFETGTLRHLHTRYVNSQDVFENSGLIAEGDGELRLVVPDSWEVLEGLEERLRTESPRAAEKKPVIVALPAAPRELVAHIEEWRAIQRAIKETPALDQDAVAKRELQEQLNHATDQLVQTLARAFGSQRQGAGARWFYDKREVPVAGRPSAVASQIFDDVYSRSPHIRNELINRQDISSAAAAARKIIVERLLSHVGQESLGIEGYPPEKSIYLSVFAATGIHRQEDGVWGLQNPKDNRLNSLWTRLNQRVQAGTKQHGIQELLDYISAPPYGIRAGIGILLLLVWLIQHQDRIFIYEEGSFIPVFTDEILHQMLKRPENFKIQASAPEGDAMKILEGLALSLGITPPQKGSLALVLTRMLVRIVRGLSPYAAGTQQISAIARRVRSAIKGARDPMALFLEDLPALLEVSTADIAAYGAALRAALRELQNADRMLLDRMEQTLRGLFHHPGPHFFSELADRGQRLSTVSDLPASVRRFVDLTSALEPDDPESRRMWLVGLGLALVGKAPENWSDADEPRFAVAAMELFRSITASEQINLERRAQGPGAFHLIRVSVLDSEGVDRTGVTVLRQENSERIAAFRAKVADIAKESGIQDKELAYAVIASMMDYFQQS